MKNILILISNLLIAFSCWAEEDLSKISWTWTKQDVLQHTTGKVVGEALFIETRWKSHEVLAEYRFWQNKLFLLDMIPRAQKTQGQHHDDFVELIPKVSQTFGDPTINKAWTEVQWQTNLSRVRLRFQKKWGLRIQKRR